MNNSKRITFFLLLLVGLAFGVKRYLFSIRMVEGTSMSPTLNDGDLVLIEMHPRTLREGDVVAFDMPAFEVRGLIKRIVAGPSAEAYIEDFQLYRNGERVLEEKVSWEKDMFDCRYSEILKSPEEAFILLGDNRCQSFDSRSFGPVSKQAIWGKIFFHWRI